MVETLPTSMTIPPLSVATATTRMMASSRNVLMLTLLTPQILPPPGQHFIAKQTLVVNLAAFELRRAESVHLFQAEKWRKLENP